MSTDCLTGVRVNGWWRATTSPTKKKPGLTQAPAPRSLGSSAGTRAFRLLCDDFGDRPIPSDSEPGTRLRGVAWPDPVLRTTLCTGGGGVVPGAKGTPKSGPLRSDGVRAYQARGRFDQQIEFVPRGETGIGNSKEIWTHEQDMTRVLRPEERGRTRRVLASMRIPATSASATTRAVSPRLSQRPASSWSPKRSASSAT
jgi:hypothetical protein